MTRVCRRCGNFFDAKHGEELCARCDPKTVPFGPNPVDLAVQWS